VKGALKSPPNGRVWIACLGVLVLLAIAGALGDNAWAASAPYAQGEKVRITGIVTDAKGTPLTDVTVALVASRSSFNLRQLKSNDKDSRRVTAKTGAKGEYSIDWAWDTYYNSFEVQVGLPVREGREERTAVLSSQDITQLLQKGTPVVPALIVQNAALIAKVRQFLADLKSEDERKVYQDLGNPDEVKKVQYPDHEEVSWWYFESGSMYRFESGKLAQVVHFTPVKPF
jgi:uncharacterized protein with FMN-binding domain